jgi:hypothetical protein
MYKLNKNSNEIINSVFRTDADGTIWSIPFDESNSDYQAYLAWCAEGNVATPAENT